MVPVLIRSKRLALVKLTSIKEAALKFARVKLALVKFVFSKLPPSKFVSYKLALINEDSGKFPLVNFEFIIILLSNITLIKPVKDKFEFGKYVPVKFCSSENAQPS